MGIREAVIGALERFRSIGVDPIVGGSFASGAWGQPRQTNDIDLSAHLLPGHEPEILKAFQDEYAVGPEELHWALNTDEPFRCFSLTHMDSVFKVDVFVTGNSAYEKSERTRARRIKLDEDIEALVAAPEDVVLQKLRWFELGNRVSDRQWNDIVQVIELQGPVFDRDYVLEWAPRLGIAVLAERALAEAGT